MADKLQIVINATDNASKELKKVSDSLGAVSKRFSTESRLIKSAAGIATKATLGVTSAFAGIGAYAINSAADMEKMRVSLKTAMGGSEELAKSAFESITKFASKTPLQLEEVLRSFVKLKNMGLDPSERALQSYGDTASAMGKGLNDMVEAVADATTGEFERLKEFGIRSSAEGNKVKFTFQGVTTTVEKNAKEIENYLIKLGETKFSGGMEDQSRTLTGLISTMTDTFNISMGRIAEDSGMLQIAKDAVSSLTSFVEANQSSIIAWATNAVEQAKQKAIEFSDRLGGPDGISQRFSELFEKINNEVIPSLISLGTGISDVTRFVIEHHEAIIKAITLWEMFKVSMGIATVVKAAEVALYGLSGAANVASGSVAVLGSTLAALPLAIVISIALVGFAAIMEQIKGINQAISDLEGRSKDLEKNANSLESKLKSAEGEEKEKIKKQLQANANAQNVIADAQGSIADSLSFGSMFKAVFGGNDINSIKITNGRATGGTVLGGNPYVVGENGPEMFVPASSGRIEKIDRSTRSEAVFNFNFSGAFIGDKESFKREIIETINRRQELYSLGAL